MGKKNQSWALFSLTSNSLFSRNVHRKIGVSVYHVRCTWVLVIVYKIKYLEIKKEFKKHSSLFLLLLYTAFVFLHLHCSSLRNIFALEEGHRDQALLLFVFFPPKGLAACLHTSNRKIRIFLLDLKCHLYLIVNWCILRSLLDSLIFARRTGITLFECGHFRCTWVPESSLKNWRIK